MCIRRWMGVAILVGVLTASMASAADATNESARDAVRLLSGRRDLRLSSDDEKDQAPFSFAITASAKGIDPLSFSVERNPSGVALVGRSHAGHGYCYATDGLVVKLDTVSAGQLLIVPGANFALVWEGDLEQGTNRFNLALNAGGRSSVVLDIPSTLRSILPRARHISSDASGKTIKIDAPSAALTLEYEPAESNGYPIRSLVVEDHSGFTLRVSDIVRGSVPAKSLVGIASARFEALPLHKRLGPWTPEMFKTQIVKTEAGFWSNDANRQAGQLLAAVIDGAAPATSPTSVPATRRNKPLDDKTLADGLLRAGVASLKGQQQTANEMGLTLAQSERVKALVQQRETAFRAMLERFRAGEIDRKEAINRAAVLANLSGGLGDILDKDQLFSFQKRWFVENPAKAQADLIHRLISFLSVETSGLELSPVQAEETQELFRSVGGKYESLKLAYKVGDIDEAALRAAVPEMSAELADGLKRILTEDQYRRLESAFLAWSRTPTSKASQRR